ncbi:MAG: T9SS type A sorting domain-containing protein [Calditrichaeota bacterium]|nr:T9SS type A sorting domain-containing protein [Calditrichota bacterium]
MAKYALYRSENDSVNLKRHAEITHPKTTYIDSLGIYPGNLYVYTLFAVDTANNYSDPSQKADAGIPKITWNIDMIYNKDTTYIPLDSIVFDPDNTIDELSINISDTIALACKITKDSLKLFPVPFTRTGTGSFTMTVTDPEGFYDRKTNIQITILDRSLMSLKPATTDSPQKYEFRQNYPNPFNPTTQIEFAVPEPSSVRIELYNPLGQRVRVLFENRVSPGRYTLEVDLKDLPSGVYFYGIQAENYQSVKRMILLR